MVTEVAQNRGFEAPPVGVVLLPPISADLHLPKKPTIELGIFSPEVNEEARAVILTEETFAGRTQINGLTIDGVGTQDRDDAIFIEPDGAGFIAHVSIADVSSLVRPGSNLDSTARTKIFTRYYGDIGNDPMLPRVLSDNRLSLHQGQKRPTVTVSMPVGRNLAFGPPQITKTYLESRRALTYQEADEIIFGNNDPDSSVLRMSYGLAKGLADQRGAYYNLDEYIEFSEERTERPIRWGEAYESMILIRELMIRANMAAAEFIVERGVPALFRAHDELGDRAYYATEFRGHAGLGLGKDSPYVHFTSPIRRLSDLIIHRQILATIEGASPPYTAEELDEIASTINVAVNIERDRQDGGRAAYMKKIMDDLARQALRGERAEGFEGLLPRRVMRVASREGLVASAQEWLFGRLKEGTITSREIVPLLFGKNNEEPTQRVIEKVLLLYPSLSRQALEAFCGEKGLPMPVITEGSPMPNGMRAATASVSNDGWAVESDAKMHSNRSRNGLAIADLILRLRKDPYFQQKME